MPEMISALKEEARTCVNAPRHERATELQRRLESLQKRTEDLQRRIAELQRQLDALRRAGDLWPRRP
jgi:chaperonin cofactor prefoldin